MGHVRKHIIYPETPDRPGPAHKQIFNRALLNRYPNDSITKPTVDKSE